MAQNNLARAYFNLKDWPNAAQYYENVLEVFPDFQFSELSFFVLRSRPCFTLAYSALIYGLSCGDVHSFVDGEVLKKH